MPGESLHAGCRGVRPQRLSTLSEHYTRLCHFAGRGVQRPIGLPMQDAVRVPEAARLCRQLVDSVAVA